MFVIVLGLFACVHAKTLLHGLTLLFSLCCSCPRVIVVHCPFTPGAVIAWDLVASGERVRTIPLKQDDTLPARLAGSGLTATAHLLLLGNRLVCDLGTALKTVGRGIDCSLMWCCRVPYVIVSCILYPGVFCCRVL